MATEVYFTLPHMMLWFIWAHMYIMGASKKTMRILVSAQAVEKRYLNLAKCIPPCANIQLVFIDIGGGWPTLWETYRITNDARGLCKGGPIN